MSARERYAAGEITLEQLEAAIDHELSPSASPFERPEDGMTTERGEWDWAYLAYMAPVVLIVGLVALVVVVASSVHYVSISETCADHGGLRDVRQVIADGSTNAIICTDGTSMLARHVKP